MLRERVKERLARFVRKRLAEAQMDEVKDRRAAQGKRWAIGTVLRSVVLAMMAGAKGLREMESLTDELSTGIRRLLGIGRRLPDGTARGVLERLEPEDVRQSLHAVVRAAHRRKALEPVGLPFGVVTMDGKATATPYWDNLYAQRQTYDDRMGAYGLVRTVSCVLVSAAGRPCVDALPIPADTNEMGYFASGFKSLLESHGGLFQLVTYDAGASSEENAKTVVEAGKDYLFRLKDERRFLLRRALQVLGKSIHSQAETRDILSDKTEVVREVFIAEAKNGFKTWKHLRTVLRVRATTISGKDVKTEDRYYMSSLEHSRLTPGQWLAVVRSHWGVENNCHHTLDAVFREDDRPWIRKDLRAMVVTMLLRRIAYTLLTLFRSVTQRSEQTRATPWRDLLRWLYQVLVAASDDLLAGLRLQRLTAFR